MCSTLLSKLSLPPSFLDKLEAADFETVGDLDGLAPSDLVSELNVDVGMASAILSAVRGEVTSSGGRGASASVVRAHAPYRDCLSLLHEERTSRRIITVGQELDKLLGGGVPLHQLSEFSGVPGVGKTQLAMQLALTVQLPTALDGLESDAVYIDTEGSFYAPRCLAMAEALVAKFQGRAANTPEQRAAAARLEPTAMLGRITYFRVHDATEQLAAIKQVHELVAKQQTGRPVRLIVVDSIAFHVRHAELSYAARLKMVGQMAQLLASAAQKYHLAAVLINQVTTKVNDALGTSTLVPALGDSWAHVCNLQVSLQWRDGKRLAVLYKGLAPGEAEYRVTHEGIRSVLEPLPMAVPPPMPALHAQHHHQQQPQQPQHRGDGHRHPHQYQQQQQYHRQQYQQPPPYQQQHHHQPGAARGSHYEQEIEAGFCGGGSHDGANGRGTKRPYEAAAVGGGPSASGSGAPRQHENFQPQTGAVWR